MSSTSGFLPDSTGRSGAWDGMYESWNRPRNSWAFESLVRIARDAVIVRSAHSPSVDSLWLPTFEISKAHHRPACLAPAVSVE